MGLGMAITSGVSMNDGASSGAMAAAPPEPRRWLRMAPHDRAAGDHTVGNGPSVDSFHPAASAWAAAPDAFLVIVTNARFFAPDASVNVDVFLSSLKVRASSLSRAIFSDETVTVIGTRPFGVAPPAEVSLLFLTVHADRAIAPARARVTARDPRRVFMGSVSRMRRWLRSHQDWAAPRHRRRQPTILASGRSFAGRRSARRCGDRRGSCRCRG